MEIKISMCDVINKNNIMYPLKEMKKCVSVFNKLSQKDSKRCVYYSRMPNSKHPEFTLGKIKKRVRFLKPLKRLMIKYMKTSKEVEIKNL